MSTGKPLTAGSPAPLGHADPSHVDQPPAARVRPRLGAPAAVHPDSQISLSKTQRTTPFGKLRPESALCLLHLLRIDRSRTLDLHERAAEPGGPSRHRAKPTVTDHARPREDQRLGVATVRHAAARERATRSRRAGHRCRASAIRGGGIHNVSHRTAHTSEHHDRCCRLRSWRRSAIGQMCRRRCRAGLFPGNRMILPLTGNLPARNRRRRPCFPGDGGGQAISHVISPAHACAGEHPMLLSERRG